MACAQLRIAADIKAEARDLLAVQPAPQLRPFWRRFANAADTALSAADYEADWLFAVASELAIPATQVPPRTNWQAEVAVLQAEQTPTALPAAPLDPRVQAWLDSVDRATIKINSGDELEYYSDGRRALLWQAVLVLLRTGHVAEAVQRLQVLADRSESRIAANLLQVWRPLAVKRSP